MTTKIEEEITKLSPEMFAAVKAAIEAKAQPAPQATAQPDAEETKTLRNGSDHEAKKLVRDKYGYEPQF